jgi:HEAT repeat protein
MYLHDASRKTQKSHDPKRTILVFLVIFLSTRFAWAQSISFPSTDEVQALKRDALTVLENILREDSQGDRLSVVTALVRNGDSDAVPLLTQALLYDEAPFVRRAAAEGLARFQSANAAPALRRSALNDDTPSIRWASGVALVFWSLDERPMVESLLSQPSTLAAAAVSLQDFSAAQKFPLALWPLAQSAFIHAFTARNIYNVVERAAMLKALVQMNTTSAILLLKQALNDATEDPFIRGAAAFALGILNVKDVVPALIAALDTDLEAFQLAAAGALGRLGDVQAIAPLSKTLREARIDEVRISAASALAQFGASAIAPLSQSLQTDPSPSVRQATLVALASIGGPQAVQAVLTFLQNGYLQNCDPSSCSSLALETPVALARLGQGVLAVQLLNATLGAVREALPFLFLFAEPSLVRTLAEVGQAQPSIFNLLLHDESAFVQALALSALSGAQGCFARDTFTHFIKANDHFVRRAALEGLSLCASYDEFLLFAPAILDRDRRVRAAGNFVLSQRSDARALAPLHVALSAESVSVRLDAAGASLAYASRIARLNSLLSCHLKMRPKPDHFLLCIER